MVGVMVYGVLPARGLLLLVCVWGGGVESLGFVRIWVRAWNTLQHQGE